MLLKCKIRCISYAYAHSLKREFDTLLNSLSWWWKGFEIIKILSNKWKTITEIKKKEKSWLPWMYKGIFTVNVYVTGIIIMKYWTNTFKYNTIWHWGTYYFYCTWLLSSTSLSISSWWPHFLTSLAQYKKCSFSNTLLLLHDALICQLNMKRNTGFLRSTCNFLFICQVLQKNVSRHINICTNNLSSADWKCQISTSLNYLLVGSCEEGSFRCVCVGDNFSSILDSPSRQLNWP